MLVHFRAQNLSIIESISPSISLSLPLTIPLTCSGVRNLVYSIAAQEELLQLREYLQLLCLTESAQSKT